MLLCSRVPDQALGPGVVAVIDGADRGDGPASSSRDRVVADACIDIALPKRPDLRKTAHLHRAALEDRGRADGPGAGAGHGRAAGASGGVLRRSRAGGLPVHQARVLDGELDALLPGLPAVSIEGPQGVGKTATALQRAAQVLRLDAPGRVQAPPGSQRSGPFHGRPAADRAEGSRCARLPARRVPA